jgi:site-specific DNA-methyltransferase (adenine-specific)
VSDALVRWVSGERDFIPDGKGFMGKAWDAFVPPPAVWDECLRVLKPGGHVLAFAGSRTFDLMALSIRLAGFEIRDSVAWLYGSGFPKSLDVSKAIDKAAGSEREVVGVERTPFKTDNARNNGNAFMSAVSGDTRPLDVDGYELRVTTAPATPEAQKWQGWGTALKPAFEPVVVARKPLGGRTVAENVLLHGTGGLNIDGTRIGTEDNLNGGAYAQKGNRLVSQSLTTGSGMNMPGATVGKPFKQPQGRWPSNVMLDEFTARLVDEQSGVSKSTGGRIGKKDTSNIDFGLSGNYRKGDPGFGDVGGASRYFFVSNERETDERVGTVETGNSRDGFVACESGECSLSDGVGQGAGVISGARFFYEPKASKRDRNEGLDELPVQNRYKKGGVGGTGGKRDIEKAESATPVQNFHPTVKPTDLMRQLVRLVTPPGGVVLDPFTGSGSTGKAAILEGFEFIGVELTDEYLPIIEGRLSHAVTQRTQAEADAVTAEAETLF